MAFATATTWGFNFILSLTWPALVQAFTEQGVSSPLLTVMICEKVTDLGTGIRMVCGLELLWLDLRVLLSSGDEGSVAGRTRHDL